MSDPVEPITRDELQLATRNHGMPLEALRWPLTPAGLHYVLVHYDIPLVDEREWSLEISGGTVGSRQLSYEDLIARPQHAVVTTMECAGNGRAFLEPRPLSQPWLVEAVGTARWGGTMLRPLLEEAGIPDDTHEVVFTGLDQGVEGDTPQRYERSLPLAECMRDDVILAYEMHGSPLPSASRATPPTPTWPTCSRGFPTTAASARTGASCSRASSPTGPPTGR
jgi:sulfane dehydrogenase subunit SoxC